MEGAEREGQVAIFSLASATLPSPRVSAQSSTMAYVLALYSSVALLSNLESGIERGKDMARVATCLSCLFLAC